MGNLLSWCVGLNEMSTTSKNNSLPKDPTANDLQIYNVPETTINLEQTNSLQSNGNAKKILLNQLLKFCDFLKHEDLEEKTGMFHNKSSQPQKFISIKDGYLGRFVLTMKPLNQDTNHNIKTGNQVGISLNNSEVGTGLVIHSDITKIKVVVDSFKKRNLNSINSIEHAFENSQDLQIAPKLNSEYSKHIRSLMEYHDGDLFKSTMDIIDILIDIKKPSEPEKGQSCTFRNKNLNEDQKEIVNFALNQKEIALIQGPPGTGKTITLIEIILQELNRSNKVVACAPSNLAADNLTENLANYTQNLIRIGHPGRQSPSLLKYSLDFATGEYKKHTNRNKGRKIINKYDVIISTLSGTKSGGILDALNKPRVVIVDESCQATEALTWMPLHIASKLILAGDFHQLPPTIKTQIVEIRKEMEYSLMEKLNLRYKGAITKTLNVQYRMNYLIMKWSSLQFYNDKFIAFKTVKSHLLKDINNVSINTLTTNPLILVDTENTMKEISSYKHRSSKGNLGEAELVYKAILYLTQSGIKTEDIGVITPYNYQVELIIQLLTDYDSKLDVASVDKFQGREKEVIIFSMVRSNNQKNIGFLKESRRLNVAVTRARRLLLVICDPATVCQNQIVSSFINFSRQYGKCFNSHDFTEACSKSN